MVVLTTWVSREIEEGVIQNAGKDAALYIDAFIEPTVQELAKRDDLSQASIDMLDKLLRGNALGQHLMSLKIWGRGNVIVHSSSHELVGRSFPAKPKLVAAWQGRVAAALDQLDHEENASERKHGNRELLEIYLPVRETGSARIIAVAEFYLTGDALRKDIAAARRRTQLTMAVLALAILAALTGIVREGSSTIQLQQDELTNRVGELSVLIQENRELQERVANATARSVDAAERILRRISADLHDGPAQLVGLSLLKLDTVLPSDQPAGQEPAAAVSAAVEDLRSVLTEALRDIRNISAGLALPELDQMSLHEAIEDAISSHERRTASSVARDIGSLGRTVPNAIKNCLYRFVQEGLNNAFRHAGGRGQRVAARYADGHVEITISDRGDGFDGVNHVLRGTSMGLAGLKDRIESVGGTFAIDARIGAGVRLTGRFPIAVGDVLHD